MITGLFFLQHSVSCDTTAGFILFFHCSPKCKSCNKSLSPPRLLQSIYFSKKCFVLDLTLRIIMTVMIKAFPAPLSTLFLQP
uniref:Uncharacterized protein n=1 Tax=Anguilla anguilla TaxID=7936 RepID=A0A0E9VFJ2_ANGAN